jgi:hypothetical protein
MSGKIKADVLQALDDWKAGKPVKCLELGHTHRMTHSEEHMKSYPNTQNTIDFSKRVSNDQERAYAYCFALLGHLVDGSIFAESFLRDAEVDHSGFLEMAKELRKDNFPDVTPEEATAAEGLAWKAFHVGWARAIANHAPHRYIEVSKPAAVSAP